MKRTLILSLLGLVLFIGLIVLQVTRFTFGFVPLFLLLLAFLLLPVFSRHFRRKFVEAGYDEELLGNPAVVRYLAIATFGVCALWAFDNYVHPDESVFRNNDYHALRIDGIELQDPRMMLAGNSPQAFLDGDHIRGQLLVHQADSNGVVLEMRGFSEPVYRVSGNEMRRFDMLTTEGLPSFRAGDVVEFVQPDGRGGNRVSTLTLREHFRTYPWHFVVSKYFHHERDSIHYVFTTSDGIEQVSTETRFLKSGLPMSSLMTDVIQDFEPKGIQIVRSSYDMDLKAAKVQGFYTDSTRNRDRYYILVDADAEVSEIRVNRVPVFASRRQPQPVTATMPYDEPFVVGFGKHKSKTLCFTLVDGQLRLEYYLPEYRHLTSPKEDVPDQTLMVTTSLFDDSGERLLDAYSENVALLDQFWHPDNVFQMRPWFLSYDAGRSGTPLHFRVYSDATYSGRTTLNRFFDESGVAMPNRRTGGSIPAEAYFPGVWTIRGQTRWLVGVEDFSRSTPYRSDRMSWLILLVVILSLALVRFGPVSVTKDSARVSLNNDIEYAALLVIIAFLTIRCFLMWRETVFPPVNSISFFEFNHFRDLAFFRSLLIALGSFFAIVIVRKSRVTSYAGKRIRNCMVKKRIRVEGHFLQGISSYFAQRPVRVVILMAVSYLLAGVLLGYVPLIARFSNVLIPVALFFVFEYCIHAWYARSFREDYYHALGYNPIGDRMYPILLSFLNVLLASAYTFLKDSGYGVMFLLFGILFCSFLVSDLRYYTRDPRSRRRSLVRYCRIFLFVCVAFFFLAYKYFFIWLLDSRMVFTIVLFSVLILVFFAISVVLDAFDDLKEPSFLQIPKWTVWVASIMAAGVAFFFVSGYFIDGKHLEYRTRVHMDAPASILENNISDAASQNRFMQASLNDWILEEYEEMGKEVDPFFEKGKGYFKMQPQSKLGAMWFAQSTDIALSRFIIAEHSEWLAILFIAAFALLLLVTLTESCQRREHRAIQLAVPLVLVVQSLLIFLANTRKFIFFGQDFPLLSITSNLSSIYFFFLMGILVISSYSEKEFVDTDWDKEAQRSIDSNNKRTRNQLFRWIGLALIAFIFFGRFYQGRNKDDGQERERGVYSVKSVMDRTDLIIEPLNQFFKEYQRTHPMRLDADMSSQLSEFHEMISRPDPAFAEMARRMETDSTETLVVPLSESDSCFMDWAQRNSRFAALMLERYFTSDAHHNSMRNLMHVHNVRTYDQRGNPHDVLQFGVNPLYHRYQLPLKSREAWKGSVVGEPGAVPAGEALSRDSQGDEFFRLNPTWLADERDLALAGASSRPLRIVGESSIVDISSGTLPVAVYSSRDQILSGREVVQDPVLGHQAFMARNVLVNGERSFLYPFGVELFWMRDFAGGIRLAKETSVRHGKADEEELEKDVPITIDQDLTHAIYQIYQRQPLPLREDQLGDKTVVVADGDGRIRAMVDFRADPRDRLNPNDARKIGALLEEIDLNGEAKSPHTHQLFGTFATSPLRLGPGSSQKPIVWTAVAAGYRNRSNFWRDLQLAAIPRDYMDTRGKPVAPMFAGHRIQKRFTSIWQDEGLGNASVGLERFIYRSSNYYNAIMAYFGMLTPAQIDAMFDGNLFMDSSFSTQEQYQAAFPVMRIRGRGGNSSFRYFVSVNDYLNQDALLPSGLRDYFGLPSTGILTPGLYSRLPKYVEDDDGQVFPRSAVFTNMSYFNMDMRRDYTRERERNEYGVRSVALGMNSAWSVSPVKMAEMYGRMITANRAYSLTLDPDEEPRHEPMIPVMQLSADNGGFLQERAPLVRGMSYVFRSFREDRLRDGTAVSVYNNTIQNLGVLLDSDTGEGYYVYGKTGTIDGQWNHRASQDHLLAVIITDQRISSITDYEELQRVRFYVIYFVDCNRSAWQEVDRSILAEVLRSDSFNQYMHPTQ